LTWKSVTRKRNHVRVGEKWIEVKPLKAKATLQVLLLITPYLRDVLPSLMVGKKLDEPKLFRETMRQTMRSMVKSFPMDVIKLMSIFLNVDEKWLEENLYPEEAIETFETIMRVNRLDDLIRIGLSIGMITMGDLSWLKQDRL